MRFEILFATFFLIVIHPHTVLTIVEMGTGRLRKSTDPRIFINLVVMPVIREGEDEEPRMSRTESSKLVEVLSPVIAFENRFSGPKVDIESVSASLTSSEEAPAPGLLNPMRCRDGQFWDRELQECVDKGAAPKRRGRRHN